MFTSFISNKESIVIYLLSGLLSLGVALIGVYLESYFNSSISLSILIIPALLSSWYGGVRLGIISSIIAASVYIYFLASLPALLRIIIFVFVSYIVNLTIDKARKFDEIEKHKKKHQQYLRILISEQEKNSKANLEIKARDEFLSIASHELKTPLTLSLLQIQQALNNIRNVSLAKFSVPKLMKMLESVENQTDRLSKMIGDLSNISLITTGKLRLEPQKVDLGKIVLDVVKRVPATLSKEHYPIKLKKTNHIIGKWDQIRIEQVVTNLITNAIKYGNNKPIEVKVEKRNSSAKLIVKDNGIGIPKALQKKIFDRFERAVANKEYQGLGVGLYIANQIIAAHKGSIKVQSKQGQGSIFTVELPLNIKPKK